MGNQSSASAATPTETTETGSGVFLAEEFQHKILQDFESTVLKEEWEKRQKYLLAKNNKRRLEDLRHQEAHQQQRMAFHQENEARQIRLDQRTDDLLARFADIAIALQHDTVRVEKEHVAERRKGGTEIPCSRARTHLAQCFRENTLGNVQACDVLIEALENCVRKTMVQKHQDVSSC